MVKCRLHPYPVLYERHGDHVAHFKFTVLLLPSGPTRITGLPFKEEAVLSDKNLDSELTALMALSSKVGVGSLLCFLSFLCSPQKKKKKKRSTQATSDAEAIASPDQT